jgi:hypothetical protein
MSTCDHCALWLVRRETGYDGGEIVVTWFDPDGRGKCLGPLKGVLTEPEFGCNSFQDGGPLIETSRKGGHPWQHATPIPCPDCRKPGCGFVAPGECTAIGCPGTDKCLGLGSANDGADGRCVGTGTVLRYDDGFVGDNRTKKHPKESERVEPRSCQRCARPVETTWLHCPHCGQNLHEEGKTEVLNDVLTGGIT